MKPRSVATGFDIYFRASQSRVHRLHPSSKRTHKVRARKAPVTQIFDIPDEQMPEPPVVPKDERKIWQ